MPSKQPLVLLVEDDMFLLSLYSTKFVSEGCIVAGASSAAEALEKLALHKPALIILDVMLPDEDGIMLLKKIKRGKGTASIPVVMLSNLSDPSYREQALIYGAEDYWIKMHYDPSEIVSRSLTIINKK